eukprot:gene17301-19721_t
MDPTAVFVHRDRKSQTLAESSWQKVGIDRVTQVCFDATGRLCAIYYATNAIELWDFSSIPVPMSSLVLPKLASGKYDGFCYNLTWSSDNTQLIGVFGSRTINRMKALDSNLSSSETHAYRPYQLVVWDVCKRITTHMLRLPFGVKTIQPLSTTKYIVTSSYGNCLYELNLQDSTIKELTCPAGHESTSLAMSPAYTLYNAFSTENINTEKSTTAGDVPVDAFAAHWFDKCANFNENPYLFETVGTSALAVDLPKHAMYYCQHDTISPSHAAMLYKIDLSTPVYTVLASTTLHLPCPVLTLSVDPQSSLICAAGNNGQIKLYSAADLTPLGDQLLLDREITEILNSQGSVNTKQHFPGTGRTQSLDHKKVLPMTYSANSEYKCIGVAFYTYAVPCNSDNTRYSNNLTHHDLLYPDTITTNHSTTTTNTNNKHSAATTTSLTQHSTAERTGLLYSVQGHSKAHTSGSHSEHLILFDLDLSPTPIVSSNSIAITGTVDSIMGDDIMDLGAGDSVPASTVMSATKKLLVKGLVATALPKASVAEYIVSPLQTTTRQYAIQPLTTSASNPVLSTTLCSRYTLPKQTVLSIDEFGRLWSLRPHYKSDFPGPMYPIGYTLINKVVQYVETEEELDVVVAENSNGVNNGTSSSEGVSINMSVNVSRDSLVYSNNSSKRDFSEAFGEAAISTAPLLQVSSVTDVVLSATANVAKLPFTLAEDYVRSLPTNGANGSHTGTNNKQGSAANNLRRNFDTVNSPLRARPDLRNVYALTSPENSNLNTTSSAANTNSTSELVFDTNQTNYTDPDSTVDNPPTVTAVWAVEDFLNAPVRIQSGDFENKLARNATAAELILHTLAEPERVKQKITQIQEEAVAALRHADEVNQRKVARNAAKKQEREKEKEKEREKERAAKAYANAQLASQMGLPPPPTAAQPSPPQSSQSQGQLVVTEAQLQAEVALVKGQNPGRNVTDAQWRMLIIQDLQHRSRKKVVVVGGAKTPAAVSAPAHPVVTVGNTGNSMTPLQGNASSAVSPNTVVYEMKPAHLMHAPPVAQPTNAMPVSAVVNNTYYPVASAVNSAADIPVNLTITPEVVPLPTIIPE